MGFSVVTNGCGILKKTQVMNVRSLYGIHDSDFLFVFVGNITPNKNQKQVVDAYCLLLNENYSNINIKVIFVGGGEFQDLKAYIAAKRLSDCLFVSGPIEKSFVHDFYSAADATILTSLSEGFGLSIIEGFVYGKPNLTFKDLPAVKDLYHPDSMLLCEERDTRSLAEKMYEMSKAKWDNKFIAEYSEKFSFKKMRDNYNTLYYSILNRE